MRIEFWENVDTEAEQLEISYSDGVIDEELYYLDDEDIEIDIYGKNSLSGGLYSAFCDVLNLDFDEIAQNLLNSFFELTSIKSGVSADEESEVVNMVFDVLVKEHLLLADENIVNLTSEALRQPNRLIWEKEIGGLFPGDCWNDSREADLKRVIENRDNLVGIFEGYILVKRYVNEIIGGNQQLRHPDVLSSFSTRVLRERLPSPAISDTAKIYTVNFSDPQKTFDSFLSTLKSGIEPNERLMCDNPIQYLAGALYSILQHGYSVKICANCGKYFVPLGRSDTMYCNRPSPQDTGRTCKEYGSQKLWYDRLKDDEAAKLSRNVYMAKQMLVKRNPDIDGYKEMFEYFKLKRKEWEYEVKLGTKSREEYISWLNEMKVKKVL